MQLWESAGRTPAVGAGEGREEEEPMFRVLVNEKKSKEEAEV